MKEKFKKVLSNLFQKSTLKAIMSVLACFGVTVPDETVTTISWAYMALFGVYESLRDDSK